MLFTTMPVFCLLHVAGHAADIAVALGEPEQLLVAAAATGAKMPNMLLRPLFRLSDFRRLAAA